MRCGDPSPFLQVLVKLTQRNVNPAGAAAPAGAAPASTSFPDQETERRRAPFSSRLVRGKVMRCWERAWFHIPHFSTTLSARTSGVLLRMRKSETGHTCAGRQLHSSGLEERGCDTDADESAFSWIQLSQAADPVCCALRAVGSQVKS